MRAAAPALRACAWFGLALACADAFGQRVAFVNPGKAEEFYWAGVARCMQSAAQDLGQTLEVHYAEREHLRVFQIARGIAALPPAQRPDYVVITNDYGTGPELLNIFEGSGIRVFMAYSKPTAEEMTRTGMPRRKHKLWIGSLEPRAQDAGYLTARALITQARAAGLQAQDGKLHMLVIAGDRSTPSSIARNDGMRQAVREAGDVVIDQEVYGAWSREKASEQATVLFQRHPQARLLWAGNDLMALGAISALEQRGGVPGRSVLFSGINTSAEALRAKESGRLAALAGGHFITGAWSLVMIHDHYNGHDFADEGLMQERRMFALFDGKLAQALRARLGPGCDDVDFRRFSKTHNPSLRSYDFSMERLLKDTPQSNERSADDRALP
ncbi:periplasmic sugar-binding protein, putative [Hylemonella gracilis ATCC 19624]|uniref:Periplasmic sugar-binding protein, putative n=1 Tax=Hylemonella gracilis ATCC 19624 TaxID=887062 RepID=F3KRB5_9BURK|nr:periplasmic sugar-binding protein, putative [Hylemonella gracilis ATCC 19624]